MGVSQSAPMPREEEVFICGLHAAYPTPFVDDSFLRNVISKLEIGSQDQ